MADSRIGAVRCWRDMRALFHVRVPNPAPLGYDQDQFLTQNWFKTTQRPTQRSHPSIWVEKTTQRVLECTLAKTMLNIR